MYKTYSTKKENVNTFQNTIKTRRETEKNNNNYSVVNIDKTLTITNRSEMQIHGFEREREEHKGNS